MQDNKQSLTPEQILGNRVDRLWAWSEDISRSLPAMEQNIAMALASVHLQINAIVIALKDSGILTDEMITAGAVKAKELMEEKQKEMAEKEAANATQPQQAEPRIISAEDLEKLD